MSTSRALAGAVAVAIYSAIYTNSELSGYAGPEYHADSAWSPRAQAGTRTFHRSCTCSSWATASSSTSDDSSSHRVGKCWLCARARTRGLSGDTECSVRRRSTVASKGLLLRLVSYFRLRIPISATAELKCTFCRILATVLGVPALISVYLMNPVRHHMNARIDAVSILIRKFLGRSARLTFSATSPRRTCTPTTRALSRKRLLPYKRYGF